MNQCEGIQYIHDGVDICACKSIQEFLVLICKHKSRQLQCILDDRATIVEGVVQSAVEAVEGWVLTGSLSH
jgi:hypothetical protein